VEREEDTEEETETDVANPSDVVDVWEEEMDTDVSNLSCFVSSTKIAERFSGNNIKSFLILYYPCVYTG